MNVGFEMRYMCKLGSYDMKIGRDLRVVNRLDDILEAGTDGEE